MRMSSLQARARAIATRDEKQRVDPSPDHKNAMGKMAMPEVSETRCLRFAKAGSPAHLAKSQEIYVNLPNKIKNTATCISC